MAYEPLPGTIPHRALPWLRAQTKATRKGEYSTAEICEGLDIGTSGFTASMGPAVAAGLVKAEKREGSRSLWWSLGDGKPLPKPLDDAIEDTLLAKKHSETEPITPRPGEMLPGMRGDEPVPLPEPKPQALADSLPIPRLSTSEYIARIKRGEVTGAKPEAAQLPFNACRYIDGSVIVVGVEVREDGAVIFSPKQARAIYELGGPAC
jgi:hypothetical protein